MQENYWNIYAISYTKWLVECKEKIGIFSWSIFFKSLFSCSASVFSRPQEDGALFELKEQGKQISRNIDAYQTRWMQNFWLKIRVRVPFTIKGGAFTPPGDARGEKGEMGSWAKCINLGNFDITTLQQKNTHLLKLVVCWNDPHSFS